MAEEPDRLSQLPDELLEHILDLAPCRKAETTAVLSRRWRRLWPLPTGAVKIDIPSASLGNAEEALAASQGPVQRLAIDVGEDCNNYVDIVGDVLSHPACSGVQDIRIRAHTQTVYLHEGEFEFSFISLPSAALRVLQITNCSDLTTPLPSSTFFPCLEVLRLRRCVVTLQRLQDMVVASPQLAALQLEYVTITGCGWDYYFNCDSKQSLSCPGITTLVLLNCSCQPIDDVTIELDVPKVQNFKYTGKINQFSLRSPLPDVRRTSLHILGRYHCGDDEKCESFWNFLKNFRNAKDLKLKLDQEISNYVAPRVIGKNNSAQSITFCVEHLEIDARHNPSNHMGVLIGNFLQCCPALRDLRLKLNTADHHRRNRSTKQNKEAQLEFYKSIDHFRRRRDRLVVQLCGDDGKFEVSDIPSLSDRWTQFSCLRFNLRRLSLQFRMDMDNPNYMGIRLVKFFVERGMAIEELYIDDGNTKMWEHMNCKISEYSANPQPISENQLLARMTQELRMNQFSSSKISGCCHQHKLEVRRTNPWFARRRFTILPLADT